MLQQSPVWVSRTSRQGVCVVVCDGMLLLLLLLLLYCDENGRPAQALLLLFPS